jgi:O-antigen ligase
VVEAVTDVRTYQSGRASDTESGGLRLVFYEKSLRFVGEAPVFGHGTGSIRELFRRAATGEEGTAAAVASHNPHSQVFLVAIQLGLVGTAVLFAMWIVHLALFRGPSLAAWMGLLVVVQNLVSSPFNSHLADFNQGWLYVFGVGVLGGMVLRQASEPLQKPPVAINRT